MPAEAGAGCSRFLDHELEGLSPVLDKDALGDGDRPSRDGTIEQAPPEPAVTRVLDAVLPGCRHLTCTFDRVRLRTPDTQGDECDPPERAKQRVDSAVHEDSVSHKAGFLPSLSVAKPPLNAAMDSPSVPSGAGRMRVRLREYQECRPGWCRRAPRTRFERTDARRGVGCGHRVACGKFCGPEDVDGLDLLLVERGVDLVHACALGVLVRIHGDSP